MHLIIKSRVLISDHDLKATSQTFQHEKKKSDVFYSRLFLILRDIKTQSPGAVGHKYPLQHFCLAANSEIN